LNLGDNRQYVHNVYSGMLPGMQPIHGKKEGLGSPGFLYGVQSIGSGQTESQLDHYKNRN